MPLDPRAVIGRARVIPVLTIVRASDGPPLARALVQGGLRVVEVTLRTPGALDAIRAITADVPDVIVGAGTITGRGDIEAATKAGATYLVTPGTPPDLADALAKAPVPTIPGCATASEAMALRARGFDVLKFFPAEASGGTAWLKSIQAPLPDLAFCPTGGIHEGNARAYLELPNVLAVGGSWVAPKALVDARDFMGIAALAKSAAAARS